MTHTLHNTLFVALALTVAGCSTVRTGTNGIKTAVVNPAPNAGFIEQPERQVNRVDLPLQKSLDQARL